MRAIPTRQFERSYAAAPLGIQQAANKQLRFLAHNLWHPSLSVKKYLVSGNPDLWQARVTKDWRFYFTIEGDVYILIDIIKHPK